MMTDCEEALARQAYNEQHAETDDERRYLKIQKEINKYVSALENITVIANLAQAQAIAREALGLPSAKGKDCV